MSNTFVTISVIIVLGIFGIAEFYACKIDKYVGACAQAKLKENSNAPRKTIIKK
jgi:hypothetical protein